VWLLCLILPQGAEDGKDLGRANEAEMGESGYTNHRI